ncbi:MAG TPA: DUF3558 family protein [Candidatus Saccharimonadales bacterium]|nr:DUF3558 family protein [Candidatus Saccharimonadales bacterium]
MKKGYIIGSIIAALIIALAVTLFIIKNNSSAPAAPSESSEPATNLTTYDACELLPEDKAKSLLGAASLVEEATPQSSDDLRVTSCTYNNDAGSFSNIMSASVLVRAPRTSEGAESNRQTFENTSIIGDTPVAGYGEKAAWNAATGQLNILQDDNWLIISYGHAQPTDRTLEETKKLADILF